MELITIGVLARQLECDPANIRVAVTKGLMTRRADGLFDPELAAMEWRNNVRHEVGHDNRNQRVIEMRQQAEPDQPATGGDIPERATKGTEYAKARAAVQIYEARLKKLRYEERAGTLAPVHGIQHAAHQQMRIVRDACLNIPARISAQLAAEMDEHKVYHLLEDAILQIFTDYAEGKIA